MIISDENLLLQLLAESGEVKRPCLNSSKHSSGKQTNKQTDGQINKETRKGGGGDEGWLLAGVGEQALLWLQHVQVHSPLQGLQQTGTS